ncbi:TolC family protein [Sphingosinicellaceae bacterium]|nr:TolC family protein [Sphingosinicellaceae bacterium]
MLPAPSGDPQRIDFARDPLLGFVRGAAPAQPFLDRLGEAVAHHPAVAAAIAEAQATQGVRTQVRSGLFPQLDVSLVASRQLARDFHTSDTIVESLQPRGRTDALANGDQLLFDFGATGNRIAAASARIDAARAEVERTAADTALSGVEAWYDVVAARLLVDLEAAATERQQAILDQVRARVDQGLGAGGDIARAEAMLADTLGLAARYDRKLGQALARYREAFGVEAPAQLPRPLAPESAAHSLDAAAAMARKSPAVVAALSLATAARRDWRAAHADGLPRLSAGIAATRYDVFTGSDYEVRGQLTLRQSLFAGGHQRGVVAEAAAKSRAAAANADYQAGNSERDAASAFADVAALTRSAASLETAYVANRRVRDAYVEQFRVSRGTLIELLRAEQEFQSAAAALLQGSVDLDVARYALLARTGEMLPVLGIKLDITL